MVDKKLPLRNPREFENPFFVVVHANPDKADRHLDYQILLGFLMEVFCQPC